MWYAKMNNRKAYYIIPHPIGNRPVHDPENFAILIEDMFKTLDKTIFTSTYTAWLTEENLSFLILKWGHMWKFVEDPRTLFSGKRLEKLTEAKIPSSIYYGHIRYVVR